MMAHGKPISRGYGASPSKPSGHGRGPIARAAASPKRSPFRQRQGGEATRGHAKGTAGGGFQSGLREDFRFGGGAASSASSYTDMFVAKKQAEARRREAAAQRLQDRPNWIDTPPVDAKLTPREKLENKRARATEGDVARRIFKGEATEADDQIIERGIRTNVPHNVSHHAKMHGDELVTPWKNFEDDKLDGRSHVRDTRRTKLGGYSSFKNPLAPPDPDAPKVRLPPDFKDSARPFATTDHLGNRVRLNIEGLASKGRSGRDHMKDNDPIGMRSTPDTSLDAQKKASLSFKAKFEQRPWEKDPTPEPQRVFLSARPLTTGKGMEDGPILPDPMGEYTDRYSTGRRSQRRMGLRERSAREIRLRRDHYGLDAPWSSTKRPEDYYTPNRRKNLAGEGHPAPWMLPEAERQKRQHVPISTSVVISAEEAAQLEQEALANRKQVQSAPPGGPAPWELGQDAQTHLPPRRKAAPPSGPVALTESQPEAYAWHTHEDEKAAGVAEPWRDPFMPARKKTTALRANQSSGDLVSPEKGTALYGDTREWEGTAIGKESDENLGARTAREQAELRAIRREVKRRMIEQREQKIQQDREQAEARERGALKKYEVFADLKQETPRNKHILDEEARLRRYQKSGFSQLKTSTWQKEEEEEATRRRKYEKHYEKKMGDTAEQEAIRAKKEEERLLRRVKAVQLQETDRQKAAEKEATPKRKIIAKELETTINADTEELRRQDEKRAEALKVKFQKSHETEAIKKSEEEEARKREQFLKNKYRDHSQKELKAAVLHKEQEAEEARVRKYEHTTQALSGNRAADEAMLETREEKKLSKVIRSQVQQSDLELERQAEEARLTRYRKHGQVQQRSTYPW